MIVKTDQAKHSGAGTAMFSQPGIVNINSDVLWLMKDHMIPPELGGTYNAKAVQKERKGKEQFKGGLFNAQAYTDPNFLKKQLKTPGVAYANNGKQPILQIPGLDEELAKLEEMYAMKQQNAQSSKELQPELGISPSKTGMKLTCQTPGFSQKSSKTKLGSTQGSTEKLKRKVTIVRRIGQTSGFQSVSRTKMALHDHVQGIPEGPQLGAYSPNEELIKISLSRNTAFQPMYKTVARSPRERIIECEKDKAACSIEKRKAISKLRHLRESMSNSPSRPMLITEQNDSDWRADTKETQSPFQLQTAVYELNESRDESSPPFTQSMYNPTDYDMTRRSPDRQKIKAFLLKQAQETAKRGIKSFDLKKLSARHPNSIMQQQREAIPSDSRFEMTRGNIELFSNHKNTQHGAHLKPAGRTELFGKAQPQADYVKASFERVKQKTHGQLDFGTRLPHATPEIKRNFVVPDTYDTERLERAFNMTSNLKNNKVLITMEKSPLRDNVLYKKLDEDYMNDMKRETKKKAFGLADQLPLTLRKKSDWQSNASMMSRNNASFGRFNASSTYHDSSMMAPFRQGSISDLDRSSNFGRSCNPSLTQLGITMNPKASKTSLNPRNRSTSTSSFALPANIVPVNGSFLFFDEDKKRLSDLGQYRTKMRNNIAPELVNDIFGRNKSTRRMAPGQTQRF